MVAHHAPALPIQQEPDLRLSGGATLTVKAADRHSRRVGAAEIAPSHLLVAILERPGKRVRDYLLLNGASLTWLSDTALAGISQSSNLGGPAIETIITGAHELAQSDGCARVDDYYLLRALQLHGDALTNRLFLECGMNTPANGTSYGDDPLPVVFESLIASNTLVQPRVGTYKPAPITKREALWKTELRSLVRSTQISPLFIAFVLFAIGFGTLLALFPLYRYERTITAGFIISVWLVSLCMHEYGHAAAAYMNGDWGVKRRGYLSFDLRNYSNPLLTFGLPLLFMLAGGMPLPGGCVMLDQSAFRTAKARRIVALAGPAANLLCVLVLTWPFFFGLDAATPLGTALAAAALIQIVAIVFNMIPVPPLDGWQFFSAGMSEETRFKAASMGWFPMIALFMVMRSVPGAAAIVYLFAYAVAFLFRIDLTWALYGWSMLRLN